MKYNNITEEDAQKNIELFNQYVYPHLNMIYGVCVKYTHNSSDIQNNYNEALMIVYRDIDKCDISKPIQPWLYIVTKHRVLDLNLKNSRINNHMLESSDYTEYGYMLESSDYTEYGYMLESSNYVDNEYILELSNYTEVYSDDVYSALESLTSFNRDALLLYQVGYKFHEIADIEYNRGHLKNHSVNAIECRLSRAYKQLRESLTRDGKRRVTCYP